MINKDCIDIHSIIWHMKQNKQLTAIDKFWNELPEILPFTVDTKTAVKLHEAYKQAKEMEKEQKLKDFQEGYDNGYVNGQMNLMRQ